MLRRRDTRATGHGEVPLVALHLLKRHDLRAQALELLGREARNHAEGVFRRRRALLSAAPGVTGARLSGSRHVEKLEEVSVRASAVLDARDHATGRCRPDRIGAERQKTLSEIARADSRDRSNLKCARAARQGRRWRKRTHHRSARGGAHRRAAPLAGRARATDGSKPPARGRRLVGGRPTKPTLTGC